MIALVPGLDKPAAKAAAKAVNVAASRGAPGTAALVGRAENAAVAATVDTAGNTIQTLGNVASGAGMAAMLAPVGAGVVASGVGLFSKSGAAAVKKPLGFLEKPFDQVFKIPGWNKLDGVFAKTGELLEQAGNKTGVTPWLLKRNTVKGDKAFAKAGEFAAKSRNAPSALQQHFTQIEDHIGHAARGNPLNQEVFKGAQDALQESLKDNKALAKAAKPHLKAAEKAIKRATAGAAFHESANGLKTVGATVTKAFQDIPKASTGTVIMNTGFVAASTLATFGVARGVLQNFKSLREMVADEKGKPTHNVGVLDVFFGKHSQPVMAARKHFLELSGVQTTAEALGLALTIIQTAKGNNMSHSTLFKFMVPQMIAGGASQMMGASALPYYSGLKRAYNSGKEIPATAIVEFIGIASSELKQHGGAESAFTQEIAKQFSAEHLSPAQILKEIPDGIKARVAKVIADQKEAKLAAAAISTAVEPEQKASFADRVNGAKKASGEVIGAHTGKLQEATTEHANGLSV